MPSGRWLGNSVSNTEPLYYFDGAPYTYAEATKDIKAVWQKIKKDLNAASYPTTYRLNTQRGRELHQMSIVDWLAESVPGGMTSRFARLIDVVYTIEYGLESRVQSSLNFLYLLGYIGQGQLRLIGPSNEKYHVSGGNDQITDRMATALSGQIYKQTRLTAIRRNADSTYTLTLRDSRTRTETFDRVVLTIPFSILRTSVDYSAADFSPVKQVAINELGMRTNSKLHLQFSPASPGHVAHTPASRWVSILADLKSAAKA